MHRTEDSSRTAIRLLAFVGVSLSLGSGLGACSSSKSNEGGAAVGPAGGGAPGATPQHDGGASSGTADASSSGGGGGGPSGGTDGGGTGGGSSGGSTDAGKSTPSDSGSSAFDSGGGNPTPFDAGTAPGASYPKGPYGFDAGATIANMSFEGYRNAVAPWTTIQISDYYDPDGTRGIRALFLTLGEVGCGACVAEVPNINSWKAKYGPAGAAFVGALWRGETQAPDGSWASTEEVVDSWISTYKVTYDMLSDPEIELNSGVVPVDNPNGYLIDPRTMKIVQYYPGAPGSPFGLTDLLHKNGAPGY